MEQAHILTIEDELAIRALIVQILELEGHAVAEAHDVLTAMTSLAEQPPDLVLLDIGLPGTSGLDLLRHLRQRSDVPVILLTGADREEDRITGLREGADDYVVKPFSAGELLARIESVLRRSGRGRRRRSMPATPATPAPVGGGVDGLAIDELAREVRVGRSLVELTAREFDLLAFLAASPRQVFSREQLLRQVWGSSSEWQDAATVTEHVRRLRRKLEVAGADPALIQTVRGVGYRLDPR